MYNSEGFKGYGSSTDWVVALKTSPLESFCLQQGGLIAYFTNGSPVARK